MAGKATGRVLESTAPGLTTVDDSDGFRHTSAGTTGEKMLTDLKLEPEPAAAPVGEDAAKAAAAAAAGDPLDALDEDTIETRADSREVPRRAAVKHLVKRAKNNRSLYETEKQRADRLQLENEDLRKRPAAAVVAGGAKVEDEDPSVFKPKRFEKVRPQYVDPDDPFDHEAVRAARTKHDNDLEAYYDERDAHTREQTRLQTEHLIKNQTEEQNRVTAARNATAIIYQRGKARHATYDADLETFTKAGGTWSLSINEYILRLGTADLDLAADVTAALVNPANRATVDRIAGLDRTSSFEALSLFVARLPRLAAVKDPAKPVAQAETVKPGPAGDVQATTHARDPFQPGGASPESPVNGRDIPITAIPTANFDAFMQRADEERGPRGVRR